MNKITLTIPLTIPLVMLGCDRPEQPDRTGDQVPAATSPSQASPAPNEPTELLALNVDRRKRPDAPESPACPDGVCPGLGNGFYLPAIDALSVNTGGNVFFKDASLGTCAVISDVEQSNRTFESADSMETFIEHTMAEAKLSGSYSTGVLTAKGSAEAMTGNDTSTTTAFHSTHMDVAVMTHSVDFQQDTECFSEHNIDPGFLARFEALAAIDEQSVASPSSWSPYVEFLQNEGSHVMMQQRIGSRFQQWESTTSSTEDIQTKLEAKACANVEGMGEGGGWSLDACAGYSNEQKKAAEKLQTNSVKVVMGGTQDTRTTLTQQTTKENLDAFIASAEQGSKPVGFGFKPIWELLIQIYTEPCASAGKGSPACANLQRAVNLQAAYEGWTAVGCPPQTSQGTTYEEMRIAGTTELGIDTYECWVARTGCRGDDDCHIGGWGSVCYCYGSSCVDQGEAIAGTTDFRDEIRGEESGGYSEGVNNSCYYHVGVYCKCNDTWAGGLPDRTLYSQSTP